MEHFKCGIYQILSVASKKSYVGSSKQIEQRWRQHKYRLRKGIHTSPRLQQAWIKHGEDNFVFCVLEECPIDKLFEREQFYINLCNRDYNSMSQVRVITPEMRRKMQAANQRRAALRTHCPHGHEYTLENTYLNKKQEKICRACNRERVAKIYASETLEQTRERLDKNNKAYWDNHEIKRKKQNEYTAAHREKKHIYDKAYQPIKNARRRASTCL